MKGCKPNRAHPNPRDGIGIVRGCGERYECKAEKTMHRCARHRAELRGLRQQFPRPPRPAPDQKKQVAQGPAARHSRPREFLRCVVDITFSVPADGNSRHPPGSAVYNSNRQRQCRLRNRSTKQKRNTESLQTRSTDSPHARKTKVTTTALTSPQAEEVPGALTLTQRVRSTGGSRTTSFHTCQFARNPGRGYRAHLHQMTTLRIPPMIIAESFVRILHSCSEISYH